MRRGEIQTLKEVFWGRLSCSSPLNRRAQWPICGGSRKWHLSFVPMNLIIAMGYSATSFAWAVMGQSTGKTARSPGVRTGSSLTSATGSKPMSCGHRVRIMQTWPNHRGRASALPLFVPFLYTGYLAIIFACGKLMSRHFSGSVPMDSPPRDRDVSEVLREIGIGIADDRRKLVRLRDAIDHAKANPFQCTNHLYQRETPPPS